MTRAMCLASVALLLCLSCPLPSFCGGMTSPSYRISASVFSGGGERVSSTAYALIGTAGQPSPVGLSYKQAYLLYSGFWHPATLERPRVSLPWLPLLLLSD
jgi:hypothetical protein